MDMNGLTIAKITKHVFEHSPEPTTIRDPYLPYDERAEKLLPKFLTSYDTRTDPKTGRREYRGVPILRVLRPGFEIIDLSTYPTCKL
jgi:hypothetical protein